MTEQIEHIHTIRPRNTLTLLGKSKEVLYALFGEPFCEITLNNNETALMFESDKEIYVCDVHGNIVHSVNSIRERRSSVRIVPQTPKDAYLYYNHKHYRATVIDISVNAVAIKLCGSREDLPEINSPVSFCTTLETWSSMKIHIHLFANIHRVCAETRKVIAVFNNSMRTQSHEAVQNYVEHNMLRKYMHPILIPHLPNNYTVIKSDICTFKCDIEACSL